MGRKHLRENKYVLLSIFVSLISLLALKGKSNENPTVPIKQAKNSNVVSVLERKPKRLKGPTGKVGVKVVLPSPPGPIIPQKIPFGIKPIKATKPKKENFKTLVSTKVMKPHSAGKQKGEKVDVERQERQVGKDPLVHKISRPRLKHTEKAPIKVKDPPTRGLTRKQKINGRVFLRLLENGKGPEIEIAWPQTAHFRKKLFKKFSRCYGMKTALMNRSGHLFIAEGPLGEHWPINLDFYSGYVRSAGGVLAEIEGAKAQEIRSYHGKLLSTSVVRLFPRQFDAVLLGQLASLASKRFANINRVRANYGLMGKDVIVENIRVNNQRVEGRIVLPAKIRGCRA